jgi:hypothetical protein
MSYGIADEIGVAEILDIGAPTLLSPTLHCSDGLGSARGAGRPWSKTARRERNGLAPQFGVGGDCLLCPNWLLSNTAPES